MPSVTYSSVLQVRPSTVMFLARLLQQRREAVGTRAGCRALSPWSQAVLVLRWFLDDTRIRQLAADNAIGLWTCYRNLHEAIAALACRAPGIHQVLMAAVAFGATHINLDGTLIVTNRLAAGGPNGADPWWSVSTTRPAPKRPSACCTSNTTDPSPTANPRDRHFPGMAH